MCEWGTDKVIRVIRRNNADIPDGWHSMAVDSCIADYVQVMNLRRIITVGCCCGHGRGPGEVLIARESVGLLEAWGYAWHAESGRDDIVVVRLGLSRADDL